MARKRLTTRKRLTKGVKVKIYEGKKVIDEGIVQSVGSGEATIRSTKLFPGEVTEFALVPGGSGPETWRVLFNDPMDGGRCFSQRAPVYTFKPV